MCNCCQQEMIIKSHVLISMISSTRPAATCQLINEYMFVIIFLGHYYNWEGDWGHFQDRFIIGLFPYVCTRQNCVILGYNLCNSFNDQSIIFRKTFNYDFRAFWSGAAANAVVVEADAFKETDVIYRAISSKGHHDDMLQTSELVAEIMLFFFFN